MRAGACVAALALLAPGTGCVVRALDDLGTSSGQRTMLPPDVREFIVRENRCDTWRSQIQEDDPRGDWLEAQIRENCSASPAELRHLREKYAHDVQVQHALAFYEREEEGDRP